MWPDSPVECTLSILPNPLNRPVMNRNGPVHIPDGRAVICVCLCVSVCERERERQTNDVLPNKKDIIVSRIPFSLLVLAIWCSVFVCCEVSMWCN